MSETPQPKDYQREYFYQLKLAEQGKSFDELLSRFPAEDEEVTQALRIANAQAAARDPSFVLNRDALRDLKDKRPDIYSRIAPVYSGFLKEKAGLS